MLIRESSAGKLFTQEGEDPTKQFAVLTWVKILLRNNYCGYWFAGRDKTTRVLMRLIATKLGYFLRYLEVSGIFGNVKIFKKLGEFTNI